MCLRRKRTSRSNWAFRFRRMTGQVGGRWHASAPWGVWNSLITIFKHYSRSLRG